MAEDTTTYADANIQAEFDRQGERGLLCRVIEAGAAT